MDVLGNQKSVLEILTMFHHCCATRCHILRSNFKVKMHQIRFCQGSALTSMEELTDHCESVVPTVLSRPLAGFKGSYF